MKHRLKGLLALVLSLTMVFALATNAWATVTVGGVEMGDGITTTYYYNGTNGAQGSTSDTDTGNWNAKVERINGVQTLTLNGANISDTYYGSAISANGDLTINLIGDNTVTHNDSGGIAAIHVDGDLTIKEGRDDGSLTASDTGTNSDGILASGKVTIESGNVTAEGGCNGIYAGETVTISGGKVTAEGSDGGISAADVSISGGEVNATGTDGNGIFASDEVTISGGNVTATGTNGDGIYANNITITGGTVNATGSGEYGYGIYAHESNSNGGDIVISNGNVTAEGGRVGIGADDAVTITGGEVKANADDDGGVGIKAVKSITISGTETTVDVGCETGLQADIVNIAGGSTVNINAKNASDENAIDSGELNMSGDYQWSTDGITFNNSTTSALSMDDAKDTAKLYIKPLSGSAPGNTNPYPPIIYNPTPTPEPEGDKVTSSNTFDGGIASAVVVTILSATGGAWLAKKKD